VRNLRHHLMVVGTAASSWWLMAWSTRNHTSLE
jgi:hypothetical protein